MNDDDLEPPARPLRVVVADDHPVVRDGLAALLKFTPGITVADTVADGRAVVRAAVTLQPDVLVMDIQMPDLNGVEATIEITRVAPTTAILMLTMFDDDESVFAAMRAGAAGYLLKGAEQDQILRAIRAVAHGEAIFGPGIARRVLGYLSGPTRPVDKFPELTTREREVLDLLAAGLPNTAIGSRLGLATKTVSNHISSIFTKLQVASRAEAAHQARAAGLGSQR
jgi:DNA-binding NarL/FixJ family response regulator